MLISIVTPSFRNSNWLKLCIASVADQEGVDFEHIVQDAGSDDGTQDWLPSDSRVKAFIEKDNGMYDAVNRGYRKAAGEIVGYINCDEQYLPGALKAVHQYFQTHPEIDILFADTVVTDSQGGYICHKKSQVPTPTDIWLRMPVFTCSLFARRKVFVEEGIWFDPAWKDFGEHFWLVEALKRQIPIGVMRFFVSIFTETGENMNLKPNAQRERKLKQSLAPAWIRKMEKPLLFAYKVKSVLRGLYFQKPFDYSIYSLSNPEHRVTHKVNHPTAVWGRKS